MTLKSIDLILHNTIQGTAAPVNQERVQFPTPAIPQDAQFQNDGNTNNGTISYDQPIGFDGHNDVRLISFRSDIPNALTRYIKYVPLDWWLL